MHDPDTLIIPQVHMNGTSFTNLYNENLVALEHVRKAHAAVSAAEPHSRDFYLRGIGAFAEAARQHHSRLQRIESVMDELSVLLASIDEQKPSR